MSITFKIDRIENGLAYGVLAWSEKKLQSPAVSGPYGRGDLPRGLYYVYRSKLLDKNADAYCDSLKKCWMQPIDPQFSTERNNLGIHPDGNRLGTSGCIGLLAADTSPWYSAFKSVDPGSFSVLEVL